MVSDDGRAAYVLGFFKEGLSDDEEDEVAERLGEELAGEATLGGFGAASNQIGSTVEEDLQRAEMVALPILFLLSFWIFRSLVAASLPLLIGVLSIVGSLAGLRLGAEVTDLSIFAVNIVTGMGLGLSIDYSLFVVSRYREELARRDALSGPGGRLARWEALRETMRTAGRTVVFSAVTVATAMGALVIFPQRFLYSMGIGGSLVALFAGLVAITVLPAVLALLGPRVNALAPKRFQRAAEDAARPASAGFWYRLSRFVMRRPIGIATAAATVMIVAGLPFLRSEFVFADAGILPPDQSARQVDDALTDRFDAARTTPIVVEARTNKPASASRLARDIEQIKGVAQVAPPAPVGERLTRIDVLSRETEFTDSSQRIVEEIRDLGGPVDLRVGGTTAEFIDQRKSLDDHLPLAIAIIAVTTFAAIFLMTGSVVLPVKSLIMNLLTVSVAFGALVLVFQDARLEGLLDYRSPDALDQSNAIFLFAVIFGLSTDYGVFLLSRIKEARDAGADDSEAVAIGLERTGRLVSSAALLLCVALGAFITSSIIFIKEFSLGTVVGIAIDATLVRALLVPSLMQLLGRWNWWAPRPLRWVHARLGLSET
jgi:RND superfamily putative drug exporter